MPQGPFARRSTSTNTTPNRRRSTRLNFVVPIIISGRDASNQPFREETETFSVSFHGARLKTRNQILLGMQLTLENLMEGVAEKAICIRVAEAEPGQDLHEIGIQLLTPRNVWGVKDPPADWHSAEEVSPPALPSTPGRQSTMAGSPPLPTLDDSAAIQNADLEQRSAELIESVLQLLRRQAAGILRESLKEFEDRLKVLEVGAEARVIQRSERTIASTEEQSNQIAEKTVAETEVSLARLRQDLLEQLTTRTEKAILSAEETLQEKIADVLGPIVELSPDAPPGKKTGPTAKK